MTNSRPKSEMPVKIARWLPLAGLLLIIGGQLYYLPQRLNFLQDIFALSQISTLDKTRQAYHPADYDLLEWVNQTTPPDTTLLLVTASPETYGDPSYVLYHRALYHLAPRTVWWAAPVPQERYPAWWTPTDLSATDILSQAERRQADAILADGFIAPPLSHPTRSFYADTHLIFLNSAAAVSPRSSMLNDYRSSVVGHRSSVIRILLAFLTVLSVGDTVYLYLGRRLNAPLGLRLALAWLLGSGLTSWLTFLLLWSGLSLQTAVVTISLGGVILWLVTVRKHLRRNIQSLFNMKRKSIPSSLKLPLRNTHYAIRSIFITLLLIQITLVTLAALIRPLTDWDAWVNWASKANLLFITQTLSPAIYNDPARLPTNLDYPLMLPLIEAWVYTWLGHIHDPIAGLVTLWFYLALLLLFYHLATSLVSPTAALGFTTLVATIPRLERLAHSGLADVPLAALLLLAIFFIWHSWENPLFFNRDSSKQSDVIKRQRIWNTTKGCLNNKNSFPSSFAVLLTALATGLLPWLKNEGWVWWGLLLLGGVVTLGLKFRRGRLSLKQALGLIALFGAVATILPAAWQLFLYLNGTQRFTFLPLTPDNLWLHLDRYPLILLEITKRLLNPYWNFIWLICGLTLLLRRAKIFTVWNGWVIGLVAVYLLLMSLTYIFSRFDPYLAHLNNSVERLAVQTVPLLVWWLAGQWAATRRLTIGD